MLILAALQEQNDPRESRFISNLNRFDTIADLAASV